MGNCIASALSVKSSRSEVPHPAIAAALKVTTYSVETRDAEDPQHETRVRRSLSQAGVTMEETFKKYCTDGGQHISMISKIIAVMTETPNERAVAVRPVLRVEQVEIEEANEVKRTVQVHHLAPTVYYSSDDLLRRISDVGRGLRALGFHVGERVGIFEETRLEWLIAADACWTQSMTPVTMYANLGEAAILHIIREAELKVLVCNGTFVPMLHRLCSSAGVELPLLLFIDALPVAAEALAFDTRPMPLSEVEALGAKHKSTVSLCLPKSGEDLALIMYTSGTTGEPKGVMYSHGNFLATALGWNDTLKSALEEGAGAPFVAYLPLAHILEFAAEHVMLMRGVMIGYGNPKTLTNTTARPHGDLAEYKPTFFVGVPRVYEAIRKAVESKLPASGLRRSVFDRAFSDRRAALRAGRDTPVWNAKVFEAPRQLFGGRLKVLFTGGAPISWSTQEFLQVLLGCSVCQGYALTETGGGGFCQRYWETWSPESVGGPLPNVEVKLREVEGWALRGQLPCGEVCIRGPSVTKGYFRQPEKTAEAFSPDGWLYTGDIGQLQSDGSLKVVGRVKALAKNAFGEYIPLEALECVYMTNEIAVPNGVCVVVDSSQSFIAAIVLTDEMKATAFAAAHGIPGTWPSIIETPLFRDAALHSLQQTAKLHGRNHMEVVKRVAVAADEWTPENGVLTAAMKLKRHVINERYASTIRDLFAS